jgi:hypothetical protein
MRGRILDDAACTRRGLNMSATGWTQQELVQMVAQAKTPIILRDVDDRSIDDLAKIAAGGKGHVVFSDEENYAERGIQRRGRGMRFR